MKKVIYSKSAPKPVGPYSQAIQLGDFLFCSGQVPIEPLSGELVKGSISEQTEQVMRNVEAVLNEANMDFSHIVKTTIFLTDMSNFGAVNEIYGKYFPNNPPARSCVAVKQLPLNVDVEIEVLAHK